MKTFYSKVLSTGNYSERKHWHIGAEKGKAHDVHLKRQDAQHGGNLTLRCYTNHHLLTQSITYQTK